MKRPLYDWDYPEKGERMPSLKIEINVKKDGIWWKIIKILQVWVSI
jgi:hypothetical protein